MIWCVYEIRDIPTCVPQTLLRQHKHDEKKVYTKSMENRDIGALWAKVSAKGLEFLSGSVEINNVRHQIVLFKNTRKSKPNHPDWNIFPSTPRPETNPNGTEKVSSEDVPF